MYTYVYVVSCTLVWAPGLLLPTHRGPWRSKALVSLLTSNYRSLSSTKPQRRSATTPHTTYTTRFEHCLQ